MLAFQKSLMTCDGCDPVNFMNSGKYARLIDLWFFFSLKVLKILADATFSCRLLFLIKMLEISFANSWCKYPT